MPHRYRPAFFRYPDCVRVWSGYTCPVARPPRIYADPWTRLELVQAFRMSGACPPMFGPENERGLAEVAGAEETPRVGARVVFVQTLTFPLEGLTVEAGERGTVAHARHGRMSVMLEQLYMQLTLTSNCLRIRAHTAGNVLAALRLVRPDGSFMEPLSNPGTSHTQDRAHLDNG